MKNMSQKIFPKMIHKQTIIDIIINSGIIFTLAVILSIILIGLIILLGRPDKR
jgi:hypothetical protein